jgi:hypothetical protein
MLVDLRSPIGLLAPLELPFSAPRGFIVYAKDAINGVQSAIRCMIKSTLTILTPFKQFY